MGEANWKDLIQFIKNFRSRSNRPVRAVQDDISRQSLYAEGHLRGSGYALRPSQQHHRSAAASFFHVYMKFSLYLSTILNVIFFPGFSPFFFQRCTYNAKRRSIKPVFTECRSRRRKKGTMTLFTVVLSWPFGKTFYENLTVIVYSHLDLNPFFSIILYESTFFVFLFYFFLFSRFFKFVTALKKHEIF